MAGFNWKATLDVSQAMRELERLGNQGVREINRLADAERKKINDLNDWDKAVASHIYKCTSCGYYSDLCNITCPKCNCTYFTEVVSTWEKVDAIKKTNSTPYEEDRPELKYLKASVFSSFQPINSIETDDGSLVFAIDFYIKNTSVNKKIDYMGIWDKCSLKDDIGNLYRWYDIYPFPEGQVNHWRGISIYPEQEIHDSVIFEIPVKTAKIVYLDTPFGSCSFDLNGENTANEDFMPDENSISDEGIFSKEMESYRPNRWKKIWGWIYKYS